MTTANDRNPLFANKLLFVAVLFLVLLALAEGLAHWCAWRDVAHAGARTVALEPLVYYRGYFTLAAGTLLVAAALCFYVLRRPTEPAGYWLAFWSFAFLAFLVYWCWAYVVPTGEEWGRLVRLAPQGAAARRDLAPPLASLLLILWWAMDLGLGWAGMVCCPGRTSVVVRIQRSILHLVVFVWFLVAAFRPTAGPLMHGLGGLLVVAVLASLAVRVVVRRMDPDSLSGHLYRGFFTVLNTVGLPWYRLPTALGIMNLGALRDVLREQNLVGTEDIPVTNPAGRDAPPSPASAADLQTRNYDGYYNDLRPGKAEMGSASTNSAKPQEPATFDRSNPGARFGRNVPRAASYPDVARLLEPSPREISRHLLARDSLKEAPILNFLAAAWIQFETHDWFFHGEPPTGNEIPIPLADGDAWDPSRAMLVRRTRPDPTRDYASEAQAAGRPGTPKAPPPTYVNAGTHWWDASQIYGDDPITTARLRTPPGDKDPLPGGKLFVTAQQHLPIDPADPNFPVELTGFTGNWWLGLMLLHTLFVREHNAICDHLRAAYTHWDGERLFQTARLVNAALMAKIHTVEWTPAILPNPALQKGMNINWWGVAGEPVKKVFGRISEGEAFSGIPGSTVNHHAADYSLTEEFVSVYRMHPLLRDELTVYSATTGQQLDVFEIKDVVGPDARKRGLQKAGLEDLFYSFGICHPGALCLRNFPNFLRDFCRPDGNRIDLAAIDVLRDRERGVPRYNRFRHYLHLPTFRSLDHLIGASRQLSADKALAGELKRIYGNDVERVDLMVGMFAEDPPPSFGFSDTAFRVFILMASRRLKSDRFFTTDFTPQVYSPAGLAWLDDSTMRTVLLRHYPALAPALRGVENAFAPWRTLDQSRVYHPYEPDLDAGRAPPP